LPRAKNTVETEPIKLSTTPEVCAQLDKLIATGLFGKNRSEAAEQLLREKLRELLVQGWPGAAAGGKRR
jgi:hypothetical protein